MSNVVDTWNAIAQALKDVAGLRVYQDETSDISPPGAFIGPPQLEWGAPCPTPTLARFQILLMEKVDARTAERLQNMVVAVAEAIESVPDAVISAPASPINEAGLPGYVITVEVGV